MKKTICCALALFLCLTGCQKQEENVADLSSADIAEAIIESQTEQVEDGAIYYADGVEASEIAVRRFTNAESCRKSEEILGQYIEARASVFQGYAPKEAAMAENGMVSVHGTYAALLICQSPQDAKDAFLKSFSTEGSIAETVTVSAAETNGPLKAAPQKDVYDAAAVTEAWKTGDESVFRRTHLHSYQPGLRTCKEQGPEKGNQSGDRSGWRRRFERRRGF